MTTLTIRNLDGRVKQALRKRAAANGVSMEQEVRDVLTRDLLKDSNWRPKATLNEIMRLSRKPEKPLDLKKAQDEIWDYLYQDDRR
jgi:plasmid stability protein